MVASMLIAIAICIDSFILGLSYGIKNVKISKISLVIISAITVCVLATSMFLGTVLMKVLPSNVTAILSFLIFVGLGSYYILTGYLKTFIARKKSENQDKELAQIKLLSLGVEININAANETSNEDVTDNINTKEALYLGLALSLDSVGVGLGSSLGNMNYLQIIVFAFVINMIVIPLGLFIGGKIMLKNNDIKSYWISGGILIALGISKLT